MRAVRLANPKASLFQHLAESAGRTLARLFFGVALTVSICFITAIEDEETKTLVVDPKLIARDYLKLWFWIDILASIPFELFGSLIPSKSARKAIKLVKADSCV